MSTPDPNVRPLKLVSEPVRLTTRKQAMEYFAQHLKPMAYGPKGQPIYAKKDVDALNIILPEDL